MWLEGITLIWLAPLALYDLRHRSVPHMATIGIPCLLAMLYVAVTGAWPLSILAFVAVAASERYRLSWRSLRMVLLVGAILISALLLARCGTSIPGALAIVGFWMAYELGWWAGADALTAITLALVWPDVRLLVSLAVAHLVLALLTSLSGRVTAPVGLWRLRRQEASDLDRVGTPGLPAMVVAVTLMAGWHLVAPAVR